MHAIRKELGAVIQVLIWAAGIWLAIGLLGSLRWFSPDSNPSPDVLLAIGLKFVVLLALISAFYVHEAFFGPGAKSVAGGAAPASASGRNHAVQW